MEVVNEKGYVMQNINIFRVKLWGIWVPKELALLWELSHKSQVSEKSWTSHHEWPQPAGKAGEMSGPTTQQ